MSIEKHDARDEGIKTLRAELAGAQSQAAAAKREAEVQNRACAEEMLRRESMQKNWDAMVTSVREHYDARLNAEAMLRARDAEVPGLSTTPGYTMDDVDRIEAARGKPYVKLRETVVLADAARDIHSMSAATGNETKEEALTELLDATDSRSGEDFLREFGMKVARVVWAQARGMRPVKPKTKEEVEAELAAIVARVMK